VRRLRPELWRQKNWLLHHDNAPSHTSFSPENFLPKTIRLSSATHPTFLFSRLKDRHSDTIEVIEAESQAVLNTLTEHDFHDAIKNRQQRWEL
jgi:hypothetical protein